MEYILDKNQMQQLDKNTIEKIGIPSLVLMERAALSVAQVIMERFNVNTKIIVVCGVGNNGADGVAVARILSEYGYEPHIYLVDKKKASEELTKQIEIAKHRKITFVPTIDEKEYDVVVDAVVGIGLSREIDGDFEDAVSTINNMTATVISVDIPSGVDATTGALWGKAVQADITVTFGYMKMGIMLYPGANYAGEIKVADIGFVDKDLVNKRECNFTLTTADLKVLPQRVADSHKGTYGKVLVIAGSCDCAGAAILSAKSALKSGCGMVMVYTHKDNRNIISTAFPEALVSGYEEFEVGKLQKNIEWADSIVLGPGMGVDNISKSIVEYVLENSKCPIVIDADGINIMAENKALLKYLRPNAVVTPHLREMSRLIDKDVTEIKGNIVDICKSFASENNCVCILKDARSIVAKSLQRVYINSVGNSGMATAGSGDVLTGIIASLLAGGMGCFNSACYGCLIHGIAGEMASKNLGQRSVIASDILENIYGVFTL